MLERYADSRLWLEMMSISLINAIYNVTGQNISFFITRWINWQFSYFSLLIYSNILKIMKHLKNYSNWSSSLPLSNDHETNDVNSAI